MAIPVYYVDSFTGPGLLGNPAAVCPLQAWMEDDRLQALAVRNGLSETAFLVGRAGQYEIRWFTPAQEVDLCGHATLAAGHLILRVLDRSRELVSFQSQSGPLRVTRDGDLLALDFPARPPEPCEAPPALAAGLGKRPAQVLGSRDYLAVYESEEDVRGLQPDMGKLRTLDRLGVIATAPGIACDFVSRFFAPGAGVDEDPVTGSAHCTLAPFWGERLGRERLHARQVSARGGELFCEVSGERVKIAGRTHMQGKKVLEGT